MFPRGNLGVPYVTGMKLIKTEDKPRERNPIDFVSQGGQSLSSHNIKRIKISIGKRKNHLIMGSTNANDNDHCNLK